MQRDKRFFFRHHRWQLPETRIPSGIAVFLKIQFQDFFLRSVFPLRVRFVNEIRIISRQSIENKEKFLSNL